jgi:hypothetical protein
MQVPIHTIVVFLLASLTAGSAHAMDCRNWKLMSSEARWSWLDERIRWGVYESPDARSYEVDKAKLLRCMQDRRQAIADDFDAICAEGQRRDKDALAERLQSHFWSCLH